MSDLVVGFIRTTVPAIVGAILAWLATIGLEIDAESSTALITGLTALITSAYWLVVRLISKKLPWVESLLGHTKTPNYDNK